MQTQGDRQTNEAACCHPFSFFLVDIVTHITEFLICREGGREEEA